MVRAASSAAPGLYTGVNPDLAPPGSLQQAYGLVCKRPGLLQKQRPFRQYSSGLDSAFNHSLSTWGIGYSISSGGRLLLTSTLGNLWMEGLSGGVGTGVFTATGALANIWLRTAEANGNTYIRGRANATPSAAGAYVGMLRLGSGDQVQSAGVPRALDLYLTDQAGTLIPTTGQSVAYRATLYSLDDQGNRVTGAPSGRAVFTTTADNRDVVLKMFLPYLVTLGDGSKFRWEVWRSKVFAVATAPDDELQLIADYGISSADVAAGYVTFTDNTPDAMRADALYTNPSQDGIGFANDPPPVANDLAYFKNFMLLANTYQKQRATLQVLGVPEEWVATDVAHATPGAGQATVTFSGTPDLAGFDNTFKLSLVGTTHYNATFAIANYTGGNFVNGIDNIGKKIVITTAIASDDSAMVGATAISGKFVTSNAVLSAYYPSYQAEDKTAHYFQVPTNAVSLALRVQGMTASLLRIINQNPTGGVVGYNAVSDPLGAPGKILFEEISIGGQAFTVYALGTSTAAYVNAYSNKFAPTIAQSAPLTSVSDARINRVHYSKYGEPEHFPIAQFLDIGSRSANILRMVALRDAVLVFKEDGLFRITSDGVNLFWSVVDPTQLLIAEELVSSLHNVAVAVTSRGVWLFSEVGAEYVSGPVQDLLDKCIQPNSTGPFPGRDVVGSTALSRLTVSPNDGLVYIYLNKKNVVAASDAVGLVYSLQTRVWTQQWANVAGYDSTTPDGVTGQVNFAEMAFTVINGMRVGVTASATGTTYDIYIEDQYALVGSIFAEYASGLLGNQKAADPVPGHKYLLDVSSFNSGLLLITAKALAGPGLALGTYLSVRRGGTIYKISNVGATVGGYTTYTLTPVFGGPESPLASGRMYYYADQPASWGYQTFVAGDDATVKQWIEARLSLDPKSTISAGSVTMYTYTEAGDGSPQSDSGPPAAPSTLVRLGVESKSQAGRMISVFCSHRNKLEFLYIRGMAYSFEVVEDDRADV